MAGWKEVRTEEPVFDLVAARVVGRHEDLLCELESIATGKIVLRLGEEDYSSFFRSGGLGMDLAHSMQRLLPVGSAR